VAQARELAPHQRPLKKSVELPGLPVEYMVLVSANRNPAHLEIIFKKLNSTSDLYLRIFLGRRKNISDYSKKNGAVSVYR
jgi:hypothetical protein